MVLYSGGTRSGCGSAQAAMGPFYCPNDQRLYVDTTFFDMMDQQMGAGGDFAAAYVIAHEVGHHVELTAVDALLARPVEVELHQFIAAAHDRQATARRHIDLDGVAVVFHVNRARLVIDFDGRQFAGDGFGDVDGGLVFACGA